MRSLYFFTTYYPNRDVQWKTDELKVLSESFDIRVVPFEKKAFEHQAGKLPSVIYEDPLFETFQKPGIRRQLLKVLANKFCFRFLGEFLRKKVFLSKSRMILWTESAYKILKLIKNARLKRIFKEAEDGSIFYFYWGRESSEAIGFLSKTKAKIIVRFHGYDLYEYRYPGNYIPFRTSLLKRLDYAVFVSEDGQTYMKERYTDIHFKSIVSRLGTLSFGKANQSDDGVFRIVSCSSVIPLKRVDLIADAIMALNFKTEWTHIGGGQNFSDLQKKVISCPEHIRVNLVGQVPASDIPSFYADRPVDLFLNVSITEGLPVSIMEAMAAGIPVLATDVGGTREMVSALSGKLLKKEITPEELSTEITLFKNRNFTEIEDLKKNSFSVFEEMLNFEKNSIRFIHFLKHLTL